MTKDKYSCLLSIYAPKTSERRKCMNEPFPERITTCKKVAQPPSFNAFVNLEDITEHDSDVNSPCGWMDERRRPYHYSTSSGGG